MPEEVWCSEDGYRVGRPDGTEIGLDGLPSPDAAVLGEVAGYEFTLYKRRPELVRGLLARLGARSVERHARYVATGAWHHRRRDAELVSSFQLLRADLAAGTGAPDVRLTHLLRIVGSEGGEGVQLAECVRASGPTPLAAVMRVWEPAVAGLSVEQRERVAGAVVAACGDLTSERDVYVVARLVRSELTFVRLADSRMRLAQLVLGEALQEHPMDPRVLNAVLSCSVDRQHLLGDLSIVAERTDVAGARILCERLTAEELEAAHRGASWRIREAGTSEERIDALCVAIALGVPVLRRLSDTLDEAGGSDEERRRREEVVMPRVRAAMARRGADGSAELSAFTDLRSLDRAYWFEEADREWQPIPER
jgi:hypothetical protein